MSNLIDTNLVDFYDRLTSKQQKEYRTFVNKGISNPIFLNPANYLIESARKFDNPYKEFAFYMSRPENFWFTCKYLFDIDLYPFQVTILQELWNRRFPMLVGCRGMGKTFLLGLYAALRALFTPNAKIVVVGAAFRQSRLIFEVIEKLYRDSAVFRSICDDKPKRDIDRCFFHVNKSVITAIPLGDGCLSPYVATTYDYCFGTIGSAVGNKVWSSYDKKFVEFDEFYDNGVKDTKFVKTYKGYEIEGTLNHKLRILNSNLEFEWKRLDELKVNDYLPIDISDRWHNGNFNCSKEQAYALGLMLGDGCYTNKYRLGFATKDEEFVKALNSVFDKDFQQSKTDTVHFNLCSKDIRQEWLGFWNIKDLYTKHKMLPENILKANRECMSACISGLFDTDGHVCGSDKKGGQSACVGFTNTSKKLVYQLQYILLHYGIVCQVSSRKRKNWSRTYELRITGSYVKKFQELIGFKLQRKVEELSSLLSKKKRNISNDDEIPYIKDLMLEHAKNNVIQNKDYKAIYSKIKSRKKITREFLIKFIDSYKLENTIFNKILDGNFLFDRIVKIEDSSSPTYDIHVPGTHEYSANGFLSHNTKIRGLRANYIIADEFASITPEVYEVVIKGFGSVSNNPTERANKIGEMEVLKSLGKNIEAENIHASLGMGNQSIISGTAYYAFNHFYSYWQKYKKIIKSKGDQRYIQDNIFNGDIPDEGFDWRDYSVMRIPYTILPKGFMDAANIASSRANIHKAIYFMEYEGIFSEDSDGFFKRSLIEKCVAHSSKPVTSSDGSEISYQVGVAGDPNGTYVYGIDPASERDNLAIVILQVLPTHRRIVYSWTLNKFKLRERLAGLEGKTGFYSYCARKIRELIKLFPTKHIGIDSQGGGIQLIEALHNPHDMKEGEQPLWAYVKDKNPLVPDPFWWEAEDKPTDGEKGIHNIHSVNFVNAEFTSQANHGLRKDFEDKRVLFPGYDTVILAEAQGLDELSGRKFDTLEDVIIEIEELKDELATIEHSQTNNQGRDKWDTPEIKKPGGKIGRLRKDRYTALTIANMLARSLELRLKGAEMNFFGSYAGAPPSFKARTGQLYYGPDNIIGKAPPQSVYRAVRRDE